MSFCVELNCDSSSGLTQLKVIPAVLTSASTQHLLQQQLGTAYCTLHVCGQGMFSTRWSENNATAQCGGCLHEPGANLSMYCRPKILQKQTWKCYYQHIW